MIERSTGRTLVTMQCKYPHCTKLKFMPGKPVSSEDFKHMNGVCEPCEILHQIDNTSLSGKTKHKLCDCPCHDALVIS
jgi:hypothetical protein